MTTYKIVRMFQRDTMASRVIKTGLTLDEAQAHCRHRETSSSTAKLPKNTLRTNRCGAWFDGYEEEK